MASLKATQTALRMVALAALVVPATATAQSYGDQPQVLTIGAAEFEVEKTAPSGGDVIGADGYLYGATIQTTNWSAPFSLPNGALLEEFCVYYKDDVTGLLTAALVQRSLARDGETPSTGGFGFVVSTHADGYQMVCRVVNARFLNEADPDGDGTSNPVAGAIRVSAQGALGIGGVRISWVRQISPPPAMATFGDVPATDTAFQAIEALAASGITVGCGGGYFCPDSTLKRRQMAVFLARALGLHWGNP